jgi:cell division protein FtsI/penicillin-binding protein 2
VGGRRTGPLILVLLAAAAVLVQRLWQVQIEQHAIWAEQARQALRSGQVLTYDRGAIRDRSGVPLARDVAAYRLELDYRDFRRGHPLGLVAHARSIVLERPVSLEEAAPALYDSAAELIGLSPGEIYAFGRGAALARESFALPATASPFTEGRPGRASDLHYYAKALLGLSTKERSRFAKLERSPGERRSYLELLAEWRAISPRELLESRAAAWKEAGEALRDLADRLDWPTGELDQRRAPLDSLIGQLEAWRASLEDAAAARLFADVLGFEAGRIEPSLLLETHDLGFLRRELGWDPPRLVAWVYQTRSAFLRSWRDGYALERLLAMLRLAEQADAELVHSALAALYADGQSFAAALDGAPRSWRELSEAAVFPALSRAYALTDVPPAPGPALDLFDADYRSRHRRALTYADLVEMLEPARRAELEERFAAELGKDWQRRYDQSLAELWRRDLGRAAPEARERMTELCVALLDSFELGFQARIRAHIQVLLTLDPDRDGRLQVARDRLDRLSERAKSLLKDYGSRPAVLHGDPSDEVVFLLSRFGQRFPGIEVQSFRRRERTAAGGGGGGQTAPLLTELVGSVGALDAEAFQRQRAKQGEFDALRAKSLRSSEEEQRLRSLMQELLLVDESRGVSGLEAYLDRFLRGRNGYRERLGLEDVYGRGARSVSLSEAQDGEDVWLTIDPALQRAASGLINRPRYPDYDPKADRDWFAAPVGAIVLCTPEGRLLALASAPDQSALGRLGRAEGQRALLIERSLRKPTFQPLGSVFKPFVAVHALDRLADQGFGPGFVHSCEAPPGLSWAEWGGVRCHSQYGHGSMDLEGALQVSCNCYFARLGDDLGPDGLAAVCQAFGFGQPTGIESLGSGPPHLEVVPEILQWTRDARLDRQVRRAANGLQVLEGTPTQLARALCGLATGRLPSLALIERVGAQFLEPEPPRALPYSPQALDFVRAAMVGVANSRQGSAHDELSSDRIGLEIAVKTGSADLVARSLPGQAGPRRGKHTWLAGWAPARDPKLIFVVFLHDTVATASHSAAVVGRQLFELPELRRYLTAEGLSLGPIAPPGEGRPAPKATPSVPRLPRLIR